MEKGREVQYRLVRRRGMRRILLSVSYTGEVRVTAPYGVSFVEIDRFVSSRSDWIKERQAAAAPPDYAMLAGEKIVRPETVLGLRTLYLDDLSKRLPPIFKKYEALLGLHPTGREINVAKTFWGVCNREGRIRISLRCAVLPDWVLEYIVVHELSHLKYFDHSAAFKALIDSVYPCRKEAEKALKNYTRISIAGLY